MVDECRHIYVRRDESGRRFCDDCGNEVARADPPPPDVQAHIKWISLKLEGYKIRGDQHAESLRAIRDMCKAETVDLERIRLWVSDSLSGYTEPLESTLLKAYDERNAAHERLGLLRQELAASEGRECALETERSRLSSRLGDLRKKAMFWVHGEDCSGYAESGTECDCGISDVIQACVPGCSVTVNQEDGSTIVVEKRCSICGKAAHEMKIGDPCVLV